MGSKAGARRRRRPFAPAGAAVGPWWGGRAARRRWSRGRRGGVRARARERLHLRRAARHRAGADVPASRRDVRRRWSRETTSPRASRGRGGRSARSPTCSTRWWLFSRRSSRPTACCGTSARRCSHGPRAPPAAGGAAPALRARRGPRLRAAPRDDRDRRQRVVPRGLARDRSARWRRSWRSRPAAGAGARAFGLGLLSKESAVVAPALLALLRLGRFDRGSPAPTGRPAGGPAAPAARLRRVSPSSCPTASSSAAYLAIRFGPMKTRGQYACYPGGTLARTLAGMPVVWAHYLRLLVWPWPLLADYTGYFRFGRCRCAAPVSAAPSCWTSLRGARLAAAARPAGIAFGLGWFALALGPVSNFIPVPIPAAERFLTCRSWDRARRGGGGGGVRRAPSRRPARWRVLRGAGVRRARRVRRPRQPAPRRLARRRHALAATRWRSTRAPAAPRAPWAGALLSRGIGERRPSCCATRWRTRSSRSACAPTRATLRARRWSTRASARRTPCWTTCRRRAPRSSARSSLDAALRARRRLARLRRLPVGGRGRRGEPAQVRHHRSRAARRERGRGRADLRRQD